LAAAYAYRGHWKSVSHPEEREQIRKIEDDEWIHRKKVGGILIELGSGPNKLKECFLWLVGRTLGFFCHLSGWFFPMYFAGRLETQNVREYETAAHHAQALGLQSITQDLLHMAAVEKDHEIFFLGKVTHHRFLPFMTRIFGGTK
jgi:Ubiquinone biosynthesis protein COQ7